MAVRPIDGNELYRIEKLLDTDIVRQDKVALNLLEQVLYDIQHVPTLTPPNEWVNVEERLPKYNIREDGELISSKILCYCETDKTVHLVVSQKFYTGRKGEIVHPVFRYYDEWGDEIEDVSHWMPLPAPPDKDNHVPAKAPNEPLTLEELRGTPHGKIKDKTLQHICDRANELAYAYPTAHIGREKWEPCDVCSNAKHIVGLALAIMDDGSDHRVDTKMNCEYSFCPNCGRPLTDEAWAELERRVCGEV